MITREEAAKLAMGDKLIAYRNAHVRMGEATPVEFEPCIVLGVHRNKMVIDELADAIGYANGNKECGEPRISVAFHDGSTQLLRGGRLFFNMYNAAAAVRDDIVEIGRMTAAIEAAWAAYLKEMEGTK